ncbi:DUF4097 family beta strand repeat-containing protein [Microbacterium sp. GXF0217]
MSTNDNGGHEIPLTPPPAGPSGPAAGSVPPSAPVPPAASVPPAGPARRASGPGRPIGIALAVIGGIALIGSGATAAVAAGAQLSSGHSFSTTADADGIRGLDLEVGASDVSVEFGDVDEAELRVDGDTDGAWTVERDDDELVVRSPNRTFGWWFGGWWGEDERVVLMLPESLQTAGLDLDLDLGAGSLEVAGEFGEVNLHVGAGAMTIEGSAESVDADISAGRAEIALADVTEADLGISAGRLTAELTGTTPDRISFEVSAGSLELTVPDDVYNVTQEVSAGSFDNRVETSTTASSTIDARVSAGSATLRAGD